MVALSTYGKANIYDWYLDSLGWFSLGRRFRYVNNNVNNFTRINKSNRQFAEIRKCSTPFGCWECCSEKSYFKPVSIFPNRTWCVHRNKARFLLVMSTGSYNIDSNSIWNSNQTKGWYYCSVTCQFWNLCTLFFGCRQISIK